MSGTTLQQKQNSTGQTEKAAVRQQKLSTKNSASYHSFSGFPIQTKLTIGSPNDKYEREADAMADQIMRMPINSANNQSFSSSTSPNIQTKCAACAHEEDKIQRKPLMMKSAGGTPVATSALSSQLSSTKGSGSPLPSSTNQFMSNAFGADFSNVRVHTDNKAQQMNQSLNARAFTHGSDIYFNQGEYSPESSGGKRLLGHELTHVVQQNNSISFNGPEIQRLGDTTKVPSGMACNVAEASPGSSGTSIIFGLGESNLSSSAQATLSAVAAAWHREGRVGTLRVDGYASTDGSDSPNWTLSCDRAMAVTSELAAPSDGSPGVPAINLSFFAHGETNEFSGGLIQNRRASITTNGGSPAPGPVCGLSITGNDEVDHYCAAYAPSDAVSCGVFPAPNLRLAAAGVSSGASLSWSIVNGSTRASIDGPNTNSIVDIKGDDSSVSPKDVTVQLTDGSCTVNHRLTVREPTSMISAPNASSGPTFIQNIITYTVQDQFGNPMGANICVDETITICSNSISGASFSFGDAGTNANGQVSDNLRVTSPGGVPASLCIKLNQSLTAGGCGPLLNNTITFQQSGIVLTHEDSCNVGDSCP